MTYIVSVVYPAGVKFDMDYYLASHMPFVQKQWAPYGLTGWRVAHYDNEGAPYAVQGWLEWESKESADKAMASEDGTAVFADVPKFSDKTPAVLTGQQVGSA